MALRQEVRELGTDPVAFPGLQEGLRVLVRVPCSVPLSVDIFQGRKQDKSFVPRPWAWPGTSSICPCLLPSLSSHSDAEQKLEQPADAGGLPGTAKFIL